MARIIAIIRYTHIWRSYPTNNAIKKRMRILSEEAACGFNGGNRTRRRGGWPFNRLGTSTYETVGLRSGSSDVCHGGHALLAVGEI